MRHKDLHILSVGRLMYSSDNRYEIVHRENTNEFQLHIHHLKSTDEGVYECQVSTKPITAFYINLKVTKGGKRRLLLDCNICSKLYYPTPNLRDKSH